jgi:hypothetical protein
MNGRTWPGVEGNQDHQAHRKDQITSPGPSRLLLPRLGLVRSRSWRPGTAHDAHSTLAGPPTLCAATYCPAVPVACPTAPRRPDCPAFAASFQLVPDELAEGVRDLVPTLVAAVEVDDRGALAVMAMRSISSRRVAPALAARVFPVCRRSWK